MVGIRYFQEMMRWRKLCRIVLYAMPFLVWQGCAEPASSPKDDFNEISADPEVAEYLSQFEGRGDMADESTGLSPEDALSAFKYPEGLDLDLIASEPLINQPVEINFDQQGRLWVVQYNQYPYPAGLKVTNVDWHLRMQFDTVPEAPPHGVQGADKITLLEDTDGDGIADKATDAITGLNIVTGVTWGRGKIWVLNPPYLLAYPDPDADGFPDGDPIVHLRGFGLEDTHAVASSLRWGPDGWLYGCQGSTTTAQIISSVSKVAFQGQGIWRYHPETEIFELFAEGGGNTFHVEIDDKGRIYSGHNGVERGPYYKQGAYYPKNWGKHGPLTNKYAFGFLPHMAFEGEKLRFTHAFLRYGGAALPAQYDDALIAINPLHSFLQLSHFQKEGSTFKTIDQSRILTTDDGWFRPVDIKAGPDGAVYLADWYDGRLSHISPVDDWHKTSGRIYALRASNSKPWDESDFGAMTIDQLIAELAQPNRWRRQQALRQFGDRKDADAIPRLQAILGNEAGQLALEALWALHLSGGFSEEVAMAALRHQDPFVRMWAVRLLGDQRQISDAVQAQFLDLARIELHPEVRSQLAASAKRLEATHALELLEQMMAYEQDQDDPENPMLIWWALEEKAESARVGVLDLFRKAPLWSSRLVQETILERLMQRYVMEGGQDNLTSAARLLSLAPTPALARPLLDGLDEGLRGKAMTELSTDLLQQVQNLKVQLGINTLDLALRNLQPDAVAEALDVIADDLGDRGERLQYIRIFGEVELDEAVPVLLSIVESGESSEALKQAALSSLRLYDSPEIGEKINAWYPDRLRADPDVKYAALELLLSRSVWTRHLLESIVLSKRISPEDIPLQLIRQIPLLGDDDLSERAHKIWPNLSDVSAREKENTIRELRSKIELRAGELEAGRPLFAAICGSCHRLFDEGADIGPELTGYDRSDLDYLLLHTVDPNLEIREGYINFLVEMKDGQNLFGTLSDQSGGNMTLRAFNGQEVILAEDQIKKMKAQQRSIMPERILDGLTEKQLQDLFAYLMRDSSSS